MKEKNVNEYQESTPIKRFVEGILILRMRMRKRVQYQKQRKQSNLRDNDELDDKIRRSQKLETYLEVPST